MGNESINWDKLGFDYIKTDKRFLQVWKNGEWQEGTLRAASVFNYYPPESTSRTDHAAAGHPYQSLGNV